MARMNDDAFRTLVDAEVEDARVWADTEVAQEAERNLRYYLGLPIGNEVEGRSQVVSWDVFEVVESAMPSFIEPFFAGDNVGEFEPVGVEDEQFAAQATDYVNLIVRKRNPGFQVFTTWFKDALISKIGVVRTWWDPRTKDRWQSYNGLSDDHLTLLAMSDDVQVIAHSHYPDQDAPPMQAPEAMMGAPVPMLHDVEFVRVGKPRGVCIENVRPERFLVTRDACRIEDARLIGEIRTYTRSDLVEMGYARDRVEALSDYTFDHRLDRIERDGFDLENDGDGATKEITLFFGFVRADVDGDGIAEWRRVFMAGNDVLENEEVEDHEYSILTPIPLPHRIVGLAYADPIAPIQELNTALARQYVDSLFLANNPREYVVEGQVNIADMLSRRIGGLVRMKAPNMAGPMLNTPVSAEALQGIEWAQTLREQRIGVTRYNQGLQADSLNKTATGVSKIMAATQQRLQMTLRIFAETGVKDLFRRVLRLVVEYQDKSDVVRLRNQWVEFDPRTWNAEMDVTVSVGIGTGDRTETLEALAMIGQYLEKAAMSGSPIVQPENLYEFGKLLIKNARIQGGEERLLTNPADVPPKEPEPSPEQALAQAQVEAEQIKQQTSIATAQMKAQSDRERLMLEREIKAIELQIRQQELEIKRADLELKMAQTSAKVMNGTI